MITLSDMMNNEKEISKFRLIYEKYRNMMYVVAYDITKNSYDAEDIVGDSLIKVIHILNDIELDELEKSKVKNLMITITKNAAIDYLRKNRRNTFVSDLEEHLSAKSAEELVIGAEDYEELIQCIDRLNEKYRDVLRLRVMHQLDSKTTGRLLNISEACVNTRFLRAKQMLSKMLREREEK